MNRDGCNLDPRQCDCVDVWEDERAFAFIWCNTHDRFEWRWTPISQLPAHQLPGFLRERAYG